MSVVANRSDKIAVTVTPRRRDTSPPPFAWTSPPAGSRDGCIPWPGREEVNTARSLLDVCADELEMLQWGEPTGDVDLRSDRRRLSELAQDLLEGGEECVATRDDESIAPDVRRQGEDSNQPPAINVLSSRS